MVRLISISLDQAVSCLLVVGRQIHILPRACFMKVLTLVGSNQQKDRLS